MYRALTKRSRSVLIRFGFELREAWFEERLVVSGAPAMASFISWTADAYRRCGTLGGLAPGASQYWDPRLATCW